jgi:CspA family cold shock protein
MPSKTPQTAISTRSGTATYDAQDIFFRSTTALGGQALREGQTVTYELVRGPEASGKQSTLKSWRPRH